MKKIPRFLSKTKLMRGYRCLKSIYLTIHHPELEAASTPDQQALFDQGIVVGEEARKRFPGGVLVDNNPWDFLGSLKRTRELLAQKTEIIYEAVFEYKGCYARADIIQYSKDTKRWKIFEVKSSTKVNDEQIGDVGLQAWIMVNSRLPIEQINIFYINNACRFPNLETLFITEDVTGKLRALYPEILPKVSEIFSTIQKNQVPEVEIGQHCTNPNECGFKNSCWKEKNVPALSVLDLPQIKAKKWDLFSKGIVRLDDPRLTELSPIQKRAVQTFKTGKRCVDRVAIKSALASWKFPLVFLDFETINPAIPRYNGTRPYQHVPFQFSAHIWLSPQSNKLIHKEYLHVSKTDPRPNLIPALLEACGDNGSIVAYYRQFELNRISELTEYSQKFKGKLEALVARITDPLPVIRDHVYDNNFCGSFSLKAVAPAILGEAQSYKGMLIANGTGAQRAFEELIRDETSQNRKDALIKASLEYCKKDTLVMVELVKWLYQQVI